VDKGSNSLVKSCLNSVSLLKILISTPPQVLKFGSGVIVVSKVWLQLSMVEWRFFVPSSVANSSINPK